MRAAILRFGVTPMLVLRSMRRATSQTDAPGANASATINRFWFRTPAPTTLYRGDDLNRLAHATIPMNSHMTHTLKRVGKAAVTGSVPHNQLSQTVSGCFQLRVKNAQ
jgi:hypothetical protein